MGTKIHANWGMVHNRDQRHRWKYLRVYHRAPLELESPIKLIVSIIVLNADLSLFSKKFTSVRLVVELKILLLVTSYYLLSSR